MTMVKKYLRKPIEAEAVQYNGDNFDEVQDFCPDVFVEDGWLSMDTLEGGVRTQHKHGDYVVKGANGIFFICAKDVFEDLYEEADGNSRSYRCTSMLF